jgi:hypothetical protein
MFRNESKLHSLPWLGCYELFGPRAADGLHAPLSGKAITFPLAIRTVEYRTSFPALPDRNYWKTPLGLCHIVVNYLPRHLIA